MHDLDRSTGSHKDEFNLKIVIMSFVNASLRYGSGVVSIFLLFSFEFYFSSPPVLFLFLLLSLLNLSYFLLTFLFSFLFYFSNILHLSISIGSPGI